MALFTFVKSDIMCSIMLVSTFAPKKPARLHSGNSILKTRKVEPETIEMDSLENFETNCLEEKVIRYSSFYFNP